MLVAIAIEVLRIVLLNAHPTRIDMASRFNKIILKRVNRVFFKDEQHWCFTRQTGAVAAIIHQNLHTIGAWRMLIWFPASRCSGRARH